jgi:hypothetical protein
MDIDNVGFTFFRVWIWNIERKNIENEFQYNHLASSMLKSGMNTNIHEYQIFQIFRHLNPSLPTDDC